MSYHGYGKFIVFRSNEDGLHKYDLVHSDIVQFGFTVPYRIKEVSLDKPNDPAKSVGKLIQPHEWLSEYVSDCMPYELDNFVDFKLGVGEFAEICGFLEVVDTSHDTPYGYEYDNELHLEEAVFEVFKLEDLKESYYYDAWEISEWLENTEGLAEGESLSDTYNRLVSEGYNKTNEDIEMDEVDEETLRNIELAGGGS
jgi:hypothetical protein